MSEDKFFDFSPIDIGEGSLAIIPHEKAAFYTDILASSSEERRNGPGYYVDIDTTVSSSSHDNSDGNAESICSTPTEVIQHHSQNQMLQQHQQLSSMAFHPALAAQLAANSAALQIAQAQQAMTTQAANKGIHTTSVPPSMSLHQQTLPGGSMPTSFTNGTNSLTCRVATPPFMQGPNPAYSDRTVALGGTITMPMMMHHNTFNLSQAAMLQQRKGSKNMPPTPPASADEKEYDDLEKKKTLFNMIRPNAACTGGTPVSISLMQPNGQRVTVPSAGTGPGHLSQFRTPHKQIAMQDRMSMLEAQSIYNPISLPEEHDDEDLSPPGPGGVRNRKKRNDKIAVPVEEKDDKYFERRQRNNIAAKRSRDARKYREDTVAMRANFLERENAILRAQLATLREEANSLRQLLSQRTVAVGPNGQPINVMQ